jgi:hypothetical protein
MSKFKAYSRIVGGAVKDSVVVTIKVVAAMIVVGYTLDGIAASMRAGRQMQEA